MYRNISFKMAYVLTEENFLPSFAGVTQNFLCQGCGLVRRYRNFVRFVNCKVMQLATAQTARRALAASWNSFTQALPWLHTRNNFDTTIGVLYMDSVTYSRV